MAHKENVLFLNVCMRAADEQMQWVFLFFTPFSRIPGIFSSVPRLPHLAGRVLSTLFEVNS